jgi:uncharacterized membrane protein
MRPVLYLIFLLGVAGVLFSGYLTYRELFATPAEVTCTPLGAPGSALGAPPCVYGFVMYLVIATLAAFSLWRTRSRQS